MANSDSGVEWSGVGIAELTVRRSIDDDLKEYDLENYDEPTEEEKTAGESRDFFLLIFLLIWRFFLSIWGSFSLDRRIFLLIWGYPS